MEPPIKPVRLVMYLGIHARLVDLGAVKGKEVSFNLLREDVLSKMAAGWISKRLLLRSRVLKRQRKVTRLGEI